jgi:squalene-associated FAD-dependent desaturase
MLAKDTARVNDEFRNAPHRKPAAPARDTLSTSGEPEPAAVSFPMPMAPNHPTIAIVGGGLAGLAAAAALVEQGVRVELFEAKRRLGGRAGSYVERETEELVDHCQHVSMGCCTNFAHFCRRTGIDDCFEQYRTLHFFSPSGQRSDFAASRWLPAPLHLGPALWRLGYLSLREKFAIARAMLKLARLPANDSAAAPTIGTWLREQRQSPRAIELFWQVVLVSALGESLDRASLAAARKVFVDGFLAHRDAYQILVPQVSLGELYDRRVAAWLRDHGAAIHLETPIKNLERGSDGRLQITCAEGTSQPFAAVILAVPWRRTASLLNDSLRAELPAVAAAEHFAAAPITGVHLWFDRPLADLPHAVIVGRLSQWVFARPQIDPGYYHVVISASHDLAGRERETILAEVLGDLATLWPTARQAKLLRWRIVTEQEAVFSVRPGLDAERPAQATPIPNLFLAGDWTATGWPATMEGAVRSGHLAAAALLAHFGLPQPPLPADLPRGLLARLLLGG